MLSVTSSLAFNTSITVILNSSLDVPSSERELVWLWVTNTPLGGMSLYQFFMCVGLSRLRMDTIKFMQRVLRGSNVISNGHVCPSRPSVMCLLIYPSVGWVWSVCQGHVQGTKGCRVLILPSQLKDGLPELISWPSPSWLWIFPQFPRVSASKALPAAVATVSSYAVLCSGGLRLHPLVFRASSQVCTHTSENVHREDEPHLLLQ